MDATVLNAGSPELLKLAVKLAHHDELIAYVHAYHYSDDARFERIAGRVPLVGTRLNRELKRRLPPEDLKLATVIQAARTTELARNAVLRLPRQPFAEPAAERLMHRRNTMIGRVGARYCQHSDVVVAAHATGLHAFKAVQQSIPCVLNYPSIHHRARIELVEAERRKFPHLASTLADYGYPEHVLRDYDRECIAADLILVGSEFAKQTFVDRGIPADRLSVVPYGVEIDLFSPDPRPRDDRERLHVLFVGQIGQAKGMSYLLDAFEELDRRKFELTLVGRFVGNSAVWNDRRHLFHHIGHQPRSSLPEIYRAADVFVFPSLFEGMGMVAVEAMASGLPAIVSKFGPNQVVVHGESGYVIDVTEPGAIARHLRILYDDTKARRSMGIAARRQAERYSWDVYTNSARAALCTLVANWTGH